MVNKRKKADLNLGGRNPTTQSKTAKEKEQEREEASRRAAAARNSPKGGTPYRSIREMCYAIFDEKGPNNVRLKDVLELAKKIKPDTKFNRWHLYFHRKTYRDWVRAGRPASARLD